MEKWRVVLNVLHACFTPSRGFTASVTTGRATEVNKSRRPSVAVFWDLDNKPPQSVPPYAAALGLRDIAAAFGQVVDTVAYANHHAFSHIPRWVRTERQERKKLDVLEKLGVVIPEQPYICGVCGAKKKTHVDLKRHFKSLHEREQRKRMNRLNSLKGSKKVKFQVAIAEKSAKFWNTARDVIVPKVGYGLAAELRRAGFFVRTVSDEPQAADVALKSHMLKSINQRVDCICLVSDDSDFSGMLKTARQNDLHTVVVGETKALRNCADLWFSWRDVASGQALAAAIAQHELWVNNATTGGGEVFDMVENREMDMSSFVAPTDVNMQGGLYASDNEDEFDEIEADYRIRADEGEKHIQRPHESPFFFMNSGSSEDESDRC